MKITFQDGYTVEISERGTVQRTAPKKSDSIHASHFKPVPTTGRAAEFILKAGNRLEDYLHANVCGTDTIIRAGNGIREAIEEITERAVREAAKRNAQHAADRAALIEREKLASGFAEPVQVHVNMFDGYPTSVTFENRELKSVLWSSVYQGQISFMERSILDAAVAAFDATEKNKADSEARAVAERNAEFASKATEARTTGQPVVLSRWTTNRCMNGHGAECSFDNATKIVMPDGSTKTHFSCCY